MSPAQQWQENRKKLRLIGGLELVAVIFGSLAAFRYGGSYAEPVFLTLVGGSLLTHAGLLLVLWRCPACQRVQPFWQRHHRAAVGSLPECVYCGVSFTTPPDPP